MNKKIVRDAFVASIPVMAGYIVLGMGFGVLLKLQGYGLIYAIIISTTIFAGSMQYVAVELIATGASLLTTAITTFLVNARHLFYGISMVELYKGAGIKKLYMMFGLTDENYSLLSHNCKYEGKQRHTYSFFVTLFNHSYWIIGGALGSLLGGILPFDTKGMDFSLTALFVTIFVQNWKESKDHFPALLGVFVTLICLFIFGKDTFLIPTMIIICAVLCFKIILSERGAKK